MKQNKGVFHQGGATIMLMDQHGLVPDSSLYFIISRVYVPGLSCGEGQGYGHIEILPAVGKTDHPV